MIKTEVVSLIDLILSVGVAAFGLWGIYASIFLITKEKFLENPDYRFLREIFPLPAKVNYWLFKIFFFVAGSIVMVIGIQVFLRDL
ncbi:hypothetical protein LG326_16795 (plasmid) [Metaplanococcus flavidus]